MTVSEIIYKAVKDIADNKSNALDNNEVADIVFMFKTELNAETKEKLSQLDMRKEDAYSEVIRANADLKDKLKKEKQLRITAEKAMRFLQGKSLKGE